jgi:hypothetical protein
VIPGEAEIDSDASESVAAASASAPKNTVHSKQFEAAVRLANFLARPIGFIDSAHCRMGSLGPAALQAMAQSSAFHASINRGVAGAIGFSQAIIGAEMLAQLGTAAPLRLAILVITSSLDEAAGAGFMLAAAILSKRVRGLILKADRQLVQEALGAEGWDVAIHEAPLLYPRLCELDAASMAEPLFENAAGLDARREEIVAIGLQALGRFLDAVEPALSDLFALRLPPSVGYSRRSQSIEPLSSAHCEQVVKLIRRKQQSWPAIIG